MVVVEVVGVVVVRVVLVGVVVVRVVVVGVVVVRVVVVRVVDVDPVVVVEREVVVVGVVVEVEVPVVGVELVVVLVADDGEHESLTVAVPRLNSPGATKPAAWSASRIADWVLVPAGTLTLENVASVWPLERLVIVTVHVSAEESADNAVRPSAATAVAAEAKAATILPGRVTAIGRVRQTLVCALRKSWRRATAAG